MIRAGTLHHRITIQREDPTTDPQWGDTPGWADTAEIWASVREISATERQQAGQVQSDITHTITIRYRPGLTSKSRLVYRGRILDIIGVTDPDGRKRELEIAAREHPFVPTMVTSVSVGEFGNALWTFNSPVTLELPTPVGFDVFLIGVWNSPVNAIQITPAQIAIQYLGGPVVGGESWQIAATPVGVEQAADIFIPQSGVVIAD